MPNFVILVAKAPGHGGLGSQPGSATQTKPRASSSAIPQGPAFLVETCTGLEDCALCADSFSSAGKTREEACSPFDCPPEELQAVRMLVRNIKTSSTLEIRFLLNFTHSRTF